MITVTTSIDEPVQRRFELLKLAEELGNVSRACKILGYSRDSYYRFKGLFETGGQTALRGVSRRKPILKNRVQPEIEQAVVDLAFEQPAFGQIRVCNELRGRNLKVSPGGVRSIWLRHGLETFEKRMRSREASLAREKGEASPIAAATIAELWNKETVAVESLEVDLATSLPSSHVSRPQIPAERIVAFQLSGCPEEVSCEG